MKKVTLAWFLQCKFNFPMKTYIFIWSRLRCVSEGFCFHKGRLWPKPVDSRPSRIRGGRAHPSWAPARPTPAPDPSFSGFPTLANSRRSDLAQIGLYAGVEPSLAELADSRPWRIRNGRARPGRVCSCPTLAPVDPSSSY